jgi:hypothetical protein
MSECSHPSLPLESVSGPYRTNCKPLATSLHFYAVRGINYSFLWNTVGQDNLGAAVVDVLAATVVFS